MRRSKAFLELLLLLLPMAVLADSTVSPPDPVGEQIYRSHRLVESYVPLVFMVGAFLTLWLIRKIQLKLQARTHHPA